jgi:hypothetical protein
VITHVAEGALMLWLLIKGVNAAEWERPTPASTQT